MAGSCGQADIWAEEMPPKGHLAMALSLQAEALAATAKVFVLQMVDRACVAVHVQPQLHQICCKWLSV